MKRQISAYETILPFEGIMPISNKHLSIQIALNEKQIHLSGEQRSVILRCTHLVIRGGLFSNIWYVYESMTLRGTVCSTSYVSAIQIQHINQLECAMFGFDDNKQTTDTLHARTARNRTFVSQKPTQSNDFKNRALETKEFHVRHSGYTVYKWRQLHCRCD